MRQMIVTQTGAAPILSQADRPRPGPGEVLVRVHACGLNFADLLQIEGRYQERLTPPYVPGMELAGEVVALGPDAGAQPAGLRPGQPVAAVPGHGGLAEYACVPAQACIPLPDGTEMVAAAAFPVAYGTSHLALAHVAALRPGETLLVMGAAGGVGLTAVEIGAQMGARVIACARGAAKLAVARGAGAAETVDSDSPDLAATLKALGGADVVYDPVGGKGFEAALRATRRGGRILVIGFASGELPAIPANILLVKNISVIGFYWGGHATLNPDAFRDSLQTAFGWLAAGRLRPHVSHVLPLERAAEGLDLLRRRVSTGKVVITLSQPATPWPARDGAAV